MLRGSHPAVMTGPAVGARLTGRAAGAVTAGTCCLSMLMIAIDTTVVNLALPLIGRGLHAPVAGLQWTIAAYSITTASLMLTSGAIGDRFGRRRVLQAGLAVFTLASAGCSIAPNLGWLIAFRALQGAGGSALTPMSMGIITATFTDPAARTRAIGLWSGTFGVGMVAGPAAGGVLAAAWGWRSLFWITTLPGVVAMVLAGLVIPDSRAARPGRIDAPGQALVIAFLACLVYGIIEGPSTGWRSVPILAMFGASAAAFVLLVGWERRRTDPLIDLRVFRSIPFSGALAITVGAFACLGGFLFLTTLYLQEVHGLNVRQAGLQLIPLAAATAVAGPLAGRVMGRSGARGPLTLAGTALAASCLLLAQAPATAPWAFLAAAYAAFGAGYGAVNTVISAVAVAGMPRAQAGVAGGITSAGRQAGQSLGVSVAGAILADRLHGTIRDGFAGASHPAWLLIAGCGFVVLLLSLVSTSGRRYEPRHARRSTRNRGDQEPTDSRFPQGSPNVSGAGWPGQARTEGAWRGTTAVFTRPRPAIEAHG
jgi:EmrB/QacA subfamily drug resistance transporter